jgi:aspartyl-tRNA(Asn)/glutamyl-tRNA(Gln) amidotransferase subunit A
MGCEIKTFDISHYNFSAARRAGLIICEAEMRVEHEAYWLNNNEKFSPYLKSLLSYIDKKSPMDVIKSERVLDNAIIEARNILSQGDFILMPTAPQRAFSFNDAIPANQADLTSLANQTGLPAVSIPMITDNVLPSGMQLIGKGASDLALLALAEQWQTHTQFQYKIPNIIIELLA